MRIPLPKPLDLVAEPVLGSLALLEVTLVLTADALFRIAAWLAAILLGTGGFALIMRYGPDRQQAKWRWLSPGAVVATMLWMAASFGFSIYVAYISNYSATYGSMSAVVVFLMWLYLSAYIVLLGAVLNAELARRPQ